MDLREQRGIGELWLDNGARVLTPIMLYYPQITLYQYKHESEARVGRVLVDTFGDFFIEAGEERYYIKDFVTPERTIF